MNKQDIKKCVLIGIVAGIVTAFTFAGIMFGYTEVSYYYRKYKEEQAIKAGACSHCERESLRGIYNDTIKVEGDSVKQKELLLF